MIIIQIQQTAALIAMLGVAWMAADKRNPDVIPMWQLTLGVLPTLAAGAVLVATTLIRIWS